MASSLLSSSGRSQLASTSRLTLQQHVRFSHVGTSPLWLPPSTSLTLQSFPPHPNPAQQIPPALADARSVLVKGPLGQLLVPLYSGINIQEAEQVTGLAFESEAVGETQQRYDVVINVNKKEASKQLRSFWGLTRSLLQNALTGVSEGHTTFLRLVGVGYRASIEADPSPPEPKLRKTIAPGARTFFTSKEQEEAYRNEYILPPPENPQRLVLRLGYSHPVYVSIPRGITVTVPQPTRIVLKSVDKEQLGLMAARIRRWRPPEPYKVRQCLESLLSIRLHSR